MSTFTFAAGDWCWVALFWRATQKENPINPAWPAEAIQAKAAKSCLKNNTRHRKPHSFYFFAKISKTYYLI
jgi:hypothetical protein